MPGLVAQPPPDRDRGRDDDGDQQRQAGDRGDHARIAGDQPLDLGRQRDPVADRVAGGDQRGVGEQQRERDAAVDAVDDREPLEAGDPLEQRDAREQQQLDEHEVGAEQPGDAAGGGQRAREVVDVVGPARREPQADHRARVGQREQRQPPAGDPSGPCAHGPSVPPPRERSTGAARARAGTRACAMLGREARRGSPDRARGVGAILALAAGDSTAAHGVAIALIGIAAVGAVSLVFSASARRRTATARRRPRAAGPRARAGVRQRQAARGPAPAHARARPRPPPPAAAAEAAVSRDLDALIASLTLDEKAALTAGATTGRPPPSSAPGSRACA